MKKIGKKLSYLVKVFMACGLLFNNLMPLSVVLADELDNNDKVIVGGETGNQDELDNNTGDGQNNELDNPPSGYDLGDGNDEGSGDEGEETPLFTATLNDENQYVITYTGEYPEEEAWTLTVSEKLTYLDGTDSGEANTTIDLDDVVKAELAEGYVLNSIILEDNIYPGEFTATVTLGENTVNVNKTVEFEGDDGFQYDLSAYYEDEVTGNGIIPNEDDKYPVDPEAERVVVYAYVGQNSACPSMKFVHGEDEYEADEILNGILLEDIELAGHLHGEFTLAIAGTFTGCDGVATDVDENLALALGEYQDNTDKLNESAKNVELDSKYQFFGDSDEGYVYNYDEIDPSELESILEDAFGENEHITYEVKYENEELLITITDDLGIEITYKGVEQSRDTTIDARLAVDSNEVTTGDTFTVSYLVSVKDYMVNGVSGLVTYDENLLRLVDVTANEFTGSAEEGKFTFLGGPLKGTETTDDEGVVTVEEAEYLVVTLTFEALAAGEASFGIEDAKFYNEGVYYEASDEISNMVIINESTNNNLTSLNVAGQEISLEDGVLEYSITVGNDVTLPQIAADVAAGANITSIIAPEELAVGENEITIEVTAENGDVKVYSIIVTREAPPEETKSAHFETSYDNDQVVNDNDDNKDDDVETTVGPTSSDDDDDTKKSTEEEGTKSKKASRVLVVILILLAIAGLIYLIFKGDDDEETKKANKDVEKLRKEEHKEEHKNPTKKVDNNKKPNKKGR